MPEKNTYSASIATLSILQMDADLQQFIHYLNKQVHIPVSSLAVNAGCNQQITIKIIDNIFLWE